MSSLAIQALLFFFIAFLPKYLIADVSALSEQNAVKKYTIICSETNDYNEILKKNISGAYLLKSLTIVSDISIQHAEVLHEINLPEKTLINSEKIVASVQRLFKKNKFDTITLMIEVIGDNIILEIKLTSFWTFKVLKINGILTGKESIKRYYTIEYGEPFDKNKHSHSIALIQKAFERSGYFDCVIQDSIHYHESLKLVDVSLSVHTGRAYLINDIDLIITTTIGNECDSNYLKKKLQQLLYNHLLNGTYKEEAVIEVTRILKNFCMHYGFPGVNIELSRSINHTEKNISLTFVINLCQKREFIFTGNSQLKSKELFTWLSSLSVIGASFSKNIFFDELLHYYKSKGFLEASINLDCFADRYYFNINEGPRSEIVAVEFIGTQKKNKKQLEDQFFHMLAKSPILDDIMLKSFLDQIVAWYQEQGFWQAHIVRHEKILMMPGKYKLIIVIDEGPCTYLDSIVIPGYEELLSQGPFLAWHEKGSLAHVLPCPMSMLTECKKWLINYFHHQGYLHVEVKAELIGKPEKMGIFWSINKGDRIKFGTTIIQGCCPLPYQYILQQLVYKEGDPWSDEKLYRSIRNLKDLGIFRTIYRVSDERESRQTNPLVILKLIPDEPYEIRIRSGFALQQVGQPYFWGNGLTYRLGGTFLGKNLTNSADFIAFDFDWARSYHVMNLEYRRPNFFSLPVKTTVRAYNNYYKQPLWVGHGQNLYNISRQGLLCNTTSCWKTVEYDMCLGFEFVKTNIDSGITACLNQIEEAFFLQSPILGKKVPYLLFEPTIVLDYVDNRLDAHQGSLTTLTGRAMVSLLSKFSGSFFKLLIEQSIFFQLMPAVVFGFHIRLGHLFQYDFRCIMPSERFYLGGAQSVRSYDTDWCPPLGCIVQEHGKKIIIPQGGSSVFNSMCEIRFPLYKMFRGVIFQDFGTLQSETKKAFLGSTLVAGTGFGLRCNTPLGPLRFDIGWKWHFDKQIERPYAWFLTLGQAF